MVQLNFESLIQDFSQQAVLDSSATSLTLHSVMIELFKKLLYPGGQSSRCIFRSREEMKFYHVSKQEKIKRYWRFWRIALPRVWIILNLENPRINPEKAEHFFVLLLLFNNLRSKKTGESNTLKAEIFTNYGDSNHPESLLLK